MNKLVKYENKCRINLYKTEDVLEMPKADIEGRRIIAIQSNGYVASGIVVTGYPDHVVFFNYTDHKMQSLMELLMAPDLESVDRDKYPEYEEYLETIKTKSNKYEAIKLLSSFAIEYVAFLDEYTVVIDAEDKPFEDGVINLLTYQEDIDYYSRGNVIGVQNGCKLTELQNLQFYPKGVFNEAHFIELATYEIYDSVQYFNYFKNFDFYVDGVKIDLKS